MTPMTDHLTAWIAEQCELDPHAWERTSTLFSSWRAWADRAGVAYGNTKQFRANLETLGLRHRMQPLTKRAGYRGLRLATHFCGVGR